jgi:Caspase domain
VSKRIAFLIGNQTFRPDSGLLPLQGPANDLKGLARLLSDPARGRFEVNEFLDKPHHEVLPDIEQALSDAAPDDLFLIYYSGHGKLDRNGRLCLATANTRQGALLATSIPARQLGELVEHSDCDQVVLLLDCCYSGSVGVRGDVESEMRIVENARGFYIMTASSDMQAAREVEPVPGGAVMGRFTAALVSGIESGAADRERKGKVLLSDLRRHLEQVVTGQTPKFFAHSASGDPLISLSPAMTASEPLIASATQRAWIRIVQAEVASPLIFTADDWGRLAVKFRLGNAGNAPASFVTTASTIIPFEAERSPRDTLEAIFQQQPIEGQGFTLFPGEEREWSNGVVMDQSAVNRVKQKLKLTNQKVNVLFAGCVSYRSTGSRSIHKTPYLYEVYQTVNAELVGFDFVESVIGPETLSLHPEARWLLEPT